MSFSGDSGLKSFPSSVSGFCVFKAVGLSVFFVAWPHFSDRDSQLLLLILCQGLVSLFSFWDFLKLFGVLYLPP